MALNLNLDELLGDSGGSSGTALGDHGGIPSPQKDLFAEKERKAWHADSQLEARCDFSFRPRLVPRSGLWFLALWQKSLMGRTLTDIKGDDAMVDFFAREVGHFLLDLLLTRDDDVDMQRRLNGGDWALVTTPRRRHKERNFATMICEAMAPMLGIPFYVDAAFCTKRQRLDAVFEPGNIPVEKNVIVFDDFVTTGQTMRAMANLLAQYDKNMLFMTGINNKL